MIKNTNVKSYTLQMRGLTLKKYVEIGIGNRWLVRTELEHEDGTETEVKGIAHPFQLDTIYLRMWIGKKVLIIDSREGIKFQRKDRRKLKIVIGFAGL